MTYHHKIAVCTIKRPWLSQANFKLVSRNAFYPNIHCVLLLILSPMFDSHVNFRNRWKGLKERKTIVDDLLIISTLACVTGAKKVCVGEGGGEGGEEFGRVQDATWIPPLPSPATVFSPQKTFNPNIECSYSVYTVHLLIVRFAMAIHRIALEFKGGIKNGKRVKCCRVIPFCLMPPVNSVEWAKPCPPTKRRNSLPRRTSRLCRLSLRPEPVGSLEFNRLSPQYLNLIAQFDRSRLSYKKQKDGTERQQENRILPEKTSPGYILFQW